MNHIEITQNLIVLLERWQKGELNERETWEEAERLVELTDDPWPTLEDDFPERYLPYKVLDYLEDLPKELITKDDIPFFISTLSARTREETQHAIKSFQAYFSKERWRERSEQLRGQTVTDGGTKWYWYNASDSLPYWYENE